MKKESGITLIALVITIIVLLILAGVTIAMLTGENGLLSRATSTTVAQKVAEAKDNASLDVADAYAELLEQYYAKNNTSAQFTLSGTTQYNVSGLTTTNTNVTGTITLNNTFTRDTATTTGTITNGSVTWSTAAAAGGGN